MEDFDNLSDEDFLTALDQEDVVENLEPTIENEEVLEDLDTEDTVEDPIKEDLEDILEVDGEEETEDDVIEGEDTTDLGVKEIPIEDQEAIELEVDYKAQYDELLKTSADYKNFYDQATGEFVANGKTVNGFTDPKKIIQSQQMAAGLNEKMRTFKKYKGHMKLLDEKGLIDDPDKFNLALQLLEGDPEAIKKHIKDLEIDPFEMDMEKIDYVSKNQLPSQSSMDFDNIMENANSMGVGKLAEDTLLNKWDQGSTIKVMNDPAYSSELLEHMQTGTFDAVQARIEEKMRTDRYNQFSSLDSLTQYADALNELKFEHHQYTQQQQREANSREWKVPEDTVKEYQDSVSNVNQGVNEARTKAASMTKRKRTSPKKKKEVSLDQMDDDQFVDFFKQFDN